MTNTDDLSELSGILVVPPAGLAVPDHVWDAVRAWPTAVKERTGRRRSAKDERYRAYTEEHAVCADCDQSIMVLSAEGRPYIYNDPDQSRAALTLTHLIQRHGWTREGPP